MNQGETGVDCGAICEKECPPIPPPDDTKPIGIIWANVFYSNVGTYDLAAKINNPNLLWGVVEFKYDFIARDSNNAIVIEKTGTSYLLPNSDDYIIIPSIKSDRNPVKAELNITKEGQKWANVDATYSNLSLSLPFRDKIYNTKDENGFPSASAILKNATNSDFEKIDIKVVLYDENDQPIAVNVSDQRTVRSGEERLFRVFWNVEPPRVVVKQDFKATTNIFNDENFMSRFGTGEKIREYR
jgi:hypothetical protein